MYKWTAADEETKRQHLKVLRGACLGWLTFFFLAGLGAIALMKGADFVVARFLY